MGVRYKDDGQIWGKWEITSLGNFDLSEQSGMHSPRSGFPQENCVSIFKLRDKYAIFIMYAMCKSDHSVRCISTLPTLS